MSEALGWGLTFVLLVLVVVLALLLVKAAMFERWLRQAFEESVKAALDDRAALLVAFDEEARRRHGS